MTPAKRSRWIAIATAGLIAAVVIPPSLFVAWNQATFNFGVVQPDSVYRSGQMPARALAETVRRYHIKTVLNLRGENLPEAWYQDELAATLAEDATHIDIAMSSCIWMSRDQLRALVQVLESAERPLLVHCAWGSERTGLASAFAELLRARSTMADARQQLSLRYLFAPIGDGKMMAEHLEQYENWLTANHRIHGPDEFRCWVSTGFRPGTPGREEWPYDPYPLVTVKHPDANRPRLLGRDSSSRALK
jgi:protein tyrosine phosphatase (PTP) superfamily phosphohydrolase (DUF442 family)